MKQQINLYQIEKQKWIFNITFQYLILVCALFLGILFMITLYEAVHHFSMRDQLTQLQKDQMHKSKALQTIAGQVPEERTREQLVNEIKRYEDEKQAKKEILALLETNSLRNKGFSDYMEALSTKTSLGLWFTKLRFQENDNVILLEGSAVKAEYVPTLITDLGGESVFSGKQFELFKISRDEKTEKINFVIATKAATQP